MKIRRLVKAVSMAGVALLVLVASASASPITYNTVGSIFAGVGGTTVLTSTGGVSATLTFTPIASALINEPTGLSYGEFRLVCDGCSTSVSASFPAFTFNLMVNQTAPTSGSGLFAGTAAAATVFSNSNPIQIIWSPISLGPGTTNATSGTFGLSIFKTTNPTQLVALNTNNGVTSVQGTVTATPEPMSFVLIGTGLIGLGLIRRKARKS